MEGARFSLNLSSFGSVEFQTSYALAAGLGLVTVSETETWLRLSVIQLR